MEDITKGSKTDAPWQPSQADTTPASTPSYTTTDQPPYAVSPESTSTTSDSSLTGVGTHWTTWSPSAPNTTTPDTESDEEPDELTGFEDLAEALDFPYETFLRWAALRASIYREDVAMYAQSALSYRQSSGKSQRTTAECEWYAELATDGRTKSYPHEAALIVHILEEKKSARHSS